MSDQRAELDRVRGDRAALVAALEGAGARIDGDKARCPFHDDRHASGGIHKHNGTWHYTCQACVWNGTKRTGDVVDVVRQSRGLDFAGALAALGIGDDGTGAPCRAKAAPQRAPAAPRRATGGGGTLGRGETRHGAANASGDAVQVGALAAECAARLQADPGALATLWQTRAVDADTSRRFNLGITPDGAYWTFPVSVGGRVVAVKHHRADPAGDGSKCFWLPKGTGSRRAWPVCLDAPGPVWLLGGELKALAVIAAGRSAVGITGGEAADLPGELADTLAGRAVAVVGDDDEQGRRWARSALDTLRGAGLDVRLVDVGLDRAAGLKDIGDWVVSRIQDGKEPAAIAAELDAAYAKADPWAWFTLGGIWDDPATWAPVVHVPTGLQSLDDGLGGGLRLGGVHLFVGKSGRAKTQTVTQLAVNAAQAGVPVGFISLEMSRRDVAHLIAANLADVPRSWLDGGELHGEPVERLQRILGQFSTLPLTIVDDAFWTGGLTRSGLARVVADGCRRFGWRLVVLDYLALLAPESDDRSEYHTDLENSAFLKRLARVEDVALVVVASLRKYGRKDADAETTLDDVLGAGRIVYDAYNVLDLDCEQAPHTPGAPLVGLVRLRPLKTRYVGLASTGAELRFRWCPGIGRVCDLEREPMFDAKQTPSVPMDKKRYSAG